jgi:asparagine synthase (glutamine-hydrolysing)
MMDEPQADVSPMNAYLISAAARERGIKVLLSGMGGDDILTGCRRHYALEQERYWRWLPESARKTLAGVARRLPVGIPRMRQVRKAFSYAHLPQQERIASYFFWAHPDVVSGMLAPDIRAGLAHERVEAPLMEALARLPASTPLVNQMLYLDGKFFVPDHNLNFFDKVSMACGVECRVPLLDIDLIKAAASLPTQFKQVGREGKWVFKKAMERHLPKDIIYRPKTGFGMPLRVWMRDELKDMQEDLLSRRSVQNRGFFDPKAVQNLREANERGQIDGTYTLLSLMSIELWSRMFLDGSQLPSSALLNPHASQSAAILTDVA